MVDENNINYESFKDALRMTVDLSGYKRKDVACATWPTEPADKALATLNEMLNPSKIRKPTFHELAFIMNFCNRYDPLYYLCDLCRHIRPRLNTPENLKAEKTAIASELLLEAFEKFKEVIEPQEKSGHLKVVTRGT